MKKIIFALILMTMLQNCNSQEKTDLQQIINSTETNAFLKKDVEATKDNQELITRLPAYTFNDQQIENFKFGNISFERNENSYVKVLVNSFTKPQILGIMVNEKDNPSLAIKLDEYLIKQYGVAKIIEPEPTLKKDNIIFGNSAKKWIDSEKGASVFLYKNYLKSNGKQVIGFSLHVISNNAEYSEELVKELQTKKIIDWYNTRF